MHRHFVLFIAVIIATGWAQAQQAWFPIKGDDGAPVANHRFPVEIESQIDSRAGTVVVGNPRGDVTLVEFYDLNCPYCRAAATDLDDLLRKDREPKLILGVRF